MTRTHQITCAHADCPEWAVTTAFQPGDPIDRAAQHRAALAAEGWTDIEGCDYCPDHHPTTPAA